MMNLKQNRLLKSVAIATSIAIGGSHSSVNRNNIISALKLRAADVVEGSSVTTTQSLSNNASSEKPISSAEENMIEKKWLTWRGVQQSRIDTIEQIAAFENFGSNQWHKYFNHKKMKAEDGVVTVADKNEKTVVERFQNEFESECTLALQNSFLKHTKLTLHGVIPDIGSNMNQYYYSRNCTIPVLLLQYYYSSKEKNQELFNGNILPKMLTSKAVETLYQFSKQESAWSESVPFGSRMKPSEKLIKEEIRKEFERERSAKKEREDFLDEAKQLKALWGEVSTKKKSMEIFRKSTSASELKIISEIDNKIDRIDDTVLPYARTERASKMDVSSIEKLHQKYLEPLVYAIITAVADAAKRGEDEASFITTENVGLALYKIIEEQFPHIKMMEPARVKNYGIDFPSERFEKHKQNLRAIHVLEKYVEELRRLQQPNFPLENTVTNRQHLSKKNTTFPIEERSEPYHDDGISNTPTNVWFSRLGSRTVTTPVRNKVATEEDTTMSNSGGTTSSGISDDAAILRRAFAFSPRSDPEKTIIKEHYLANCTHNGQYDGTYGDLYDAWQYAYNYVSRELHARGFSFSLDVIHSPTSTFYYTDSKKVTTPASGVSSNCKTDSPKTPAKISAGGGESVRENSSTGTNTSDKKATVTSHEMVSATDSNSTLSCSTADRRGRFSRKCFWCKGGKRSRNAPKEDGEATKLSVEYEQASQDEEEKEEEEEEEEKTPAVISEGKEQTFDAKLLENESGFTGNVRDAADRKFDGVYYKLSVKTHKDAKIKNEDILGNLFGFMQFGLAPEFGNKRWESVGELKGFVTKDEYERYLKAGIKKGYSQIDDITTILELPNPNSTNDFPTDFDTYQKVGRAIAVYRVQSIVLGKLFEERSTEQKSILRTVDMLHKQLLTAERKY